MRGWRLLTTISLLALIILTVTACNPFGGNSTQSQQQIQLARGDLVIKANGSGKVTADSDAKPSFGVGGKISQLNIKEGDKVSKGAVIAQLETDSLELALSQAKVAEAQAQVSLTQAQAGQIQAESALTSAQFNLDRTKAVAEIKDAMTNVQWTIKAAQVNLTQALAVGDTTSSNFLNQYIASNQVELANQMKKLNALLAKDQYASDPASVAYYRSLVEQQYDRLILQDVRLKQQQVDIAQAAVEQNKQNIELARRSIEQAAKAAAVAQKQVNDATIKSPIDGTAVTVNVKQGDTVTASSLATSTLIYLVDTSTIQVSTQIDEIDIAGVKIGQKVAIRLDSASNTQYEGKVKSISLSPVANPQNSGVVVYEVKVAFNSPPPPEVKLGMTATVDIVISERVGVLLVPNRAIREDSQGRTVVDILVNQKVESRQIQLGIGDGVYTEVVGGLISGDVVVITRSAASTSLFGQ